MIIMEVVSLYIFFPIFISFLVASTAFITLDMCKENITKIVAGVFIDVECFKMKNKYFQNPEIKSKQVN